MTYADRIVDLSSALGRLSHHTIEVLKALLDVILILAYLVYNLGYDFGRFIDRLIIKKIEGKNQALLVAGTDEPDYDLDDAIEVLDEVFGEDHNEHDWIDVVYTEEDQVVIRYDALPNTPAAVRAILSNQNNINAQTTLERSTVKLLKQWLKEMGVKPKGNKAALINLLLEQAA